MPYKSKIKLNTEELIEFLQSEVKKGTTYQEIGDKLELSRERVRQLFNKYKLEKPHEFKQEQRVKKYMDKWGVPDKSLIHNMDLYKTMRERFRTRKASAKKNGIDFSLNFGDVVFPSHCPILGLELDYFATKRQENSPSFDRIDPSKGYEKGNVVVISWRANRIKNNGSAEEHLKIYQYLTK